FADKLAVSTQMLSAFYEFRRSQFANNGGAGAGANAVGSSIEHGVGSGWRADSAGGFDSGPLAYYFTPQRDVFNSGRAKKSSCGLYKIGFGSQRQFAGKNFFFDGQKRSLQDHFKNGPAIVRHLGHCRNVGLSQFPV